MADNNRFDCLRLSLLGLTDEKLLELRMLPGTDLDDYLTSVVAFDVLMERGYTEEFLMKMVQRNG
jgi:hypothetical protein